MTTSKISTSDGIMHYYQWVKCPQIWSWKDYTSQIYRILFNFRLVLALHDQETSRNKKPNCQQLKSALKLHIDQMMRTRNFRVRNDVVEVKKGRKPTLRGKWRSVFSGRHMDNVPEETHVVSVVVQRVETEANRDKKDDRLLLHPIRRQNRPMARDKNPHRDQAINRKALWTRVKFHANSNSVKIRHINSGIFPCVWITSLKMMCYMATNAISDMLMQKERPAKKSKKVGARDQLHYWRVYTIGLCISRFLSEKVYSTWTRKIGIKARRQSLQGHLHRIKIREWKGPSRGIIQKCAPHEALARQNSGKDHMRRIYTKKDAPAE